MKKLKDIWQRIRHIKGLKYIVVTVIAVALIGFIDENSVWHHVKNKSYIGELQDEIDRYSALHRENQSQIDMLDKDPKAIQKIARERYFMKADDEDIFVLSDDAETTKAFGADETAE